MRNKSHFWSSSHKHVSSTAVRSGTWRKIEKEKAACRRELANYLSKHVVKTLFILYKRSSCSHVKDKIELFSEFIE